jgi:hypothetical protein
LLNSLKLDGYVYQDGILRHVESALVDQDREKGFLEMKITKHNLFEKEVLIHHLKLANEHFVESRWDDSIANSRKVFEGLLAGIAQHISLKKTGKSLESDTLEWPKNVRKFLEAQGFLEAKERDGVYSIYQFLSETGGHPNIAKEEEARLLLNGVMLVSQYIMLRFEVFN